jgi:hypothetical protein
MCCGKFKKISITMYILATLFILKYIFIVVEPNIEEATPTYICPNCGATIEMVEESATKPQTEEVIPFTMEETEVTE